MAHGCAKSGVSRRVAWHCSSLPAIGCSLLCPNKEGRELSVMLLHLRPLCIQDATQTARQWCGQTRATPARCTAGRMLSWQTAARTSQRGCVPWACNQVRQLWSASQCLKLTCHGHHFRNSPSANKPSKLPTPVPSRRCGCHRHAAHSGCGGHLPWNCAGWLHGRVHRRCVGAGCACGAGHNGSACHHASSKLACKTVSI